MEEQETEQEKAQQNEQEIEDQKKHFFDYLKNLIVLQRDVDSKSIKENIYENMVFRGYTVWILVCSIIIASIGLNVGSTAVVIGAMLISPLMSPIVAVGLAVGTYNWPKLKSALKNFAVMLIISLVTSYVYFLISPLKIASSELLARTEPTLLDVFIAFVGGAAGIIAISRKEISNVIPGVAIATALMPPLCTAGYGLATFQMPFFYGAFYLFILNSIMIALATYLVVSYLRFPNYKYMNQAKAKRLRTYVTIFTIAIMVPSMFIFYGLVKKSSFNTNAETFIKDVSNVNGNRLIKSSIQFHSDTSIIEIVFMELDEKDLESINAQFKQHKIQNTNLVVHQASKSANEMLSEMLSKRDKDEKLRALEETTRVLNNRLTEKSDSLNTFTKKYGQINTPIAQLEKEIKTIFPGISSISIATIVEDSKNKLQNTPILLVSWKEKPEPSDWQKLKEYAKARLQVKEILVKSL